MTPITQARKHLFEAAQRYAEQRVVATLSVGRKGADIHTDPEMLILGVREFDLEKAAREFSARKLQGPVCGYCGSCTECEGL